MDFEGAMSQTKEVCLFEILQKIQIEWLRAKNRFTKNLTIKESVNQISLILGLRNEQYESWVNSNPKIIF